MTRLIIPPSLKYGDTVALVSPSSGLAGEDFVQKRIKTAIQRLEQYFHLNVKIMPNARNGIDDLAKYPEKRAEDLNTAFADPNIKAIISFIGGNDAIRITPYLNKDVIKKNPKIFMGYSDATAVHLFLYQLGLRSFYGPAILTDFAENVEMDEYTIEWLYKVLFSSSNIGPIATAPYYRKFGLKWSNETPHIARPKIKNASYDVINGQGIVTGTLLGGCMESLRKLRGTHIFPKPDVFKDKILFLENSEDPLPQHLLEDEIHTLGAQHILDNVKGIIIGKPQNNDGYDMIKATWQKGLAAFHQQHKPVFYNASFGHNEPKCILPYGAMAELDVTKETFVIRDSGCT
ncbi:S66 peptidase family protein [Staphylococcus sp. 17KM0847]|uniref:S66 family peptidase n=1 Tax=Staphylococcus sp. 17KM0847 TaxID=2583989 RepID=UPI0015DC4EAB|nr:S66 peptidase family protein [Staphylococcus sp. 17KM0847]QLK85260.1 LD-carboxypeptidase [Staphylococcus sp. 17KM0847]